MRTLFRILAAAWLLVTGMAVNAGDLLKVVQVAGPAYALVGPIGGRTYENHGLNANFGFIVTSAGVVLIDSGASTAGAGIIEQAIATVTKQPVTAVINTGSQDHRWLGNAYFAQKGARIIALQRTVNTQQQFAGQHVQQLGALLKDRFTGTKPMSAMTPIDADQAAMQFGDVSVELRWLGDAHFAGDAVVWLPQQRVLYSGDLVYVDRLLGVLPWSDAIAWRDSFQRMAQLAPKYIVPGHGNACGLEQAKRQTGDYLDWLVQEVGAAADNWEPIDEVVERLADAPAFSALANFDELHRGNVNRTYVQFESRR